MKELILFLKRFEQYTKNFDFVIAVGLVGILTLMVVPLPSVILDIFLTFSFTLSLLVLLVAVYTRRSLDFSVFPSLLLITTLFRLSLNVASTRLILTEGHSGGRAVGQVISSFGNFVVGNNYVIGIIVFTILVVINFVVITKGSGRVAEVAARFTLDAMPGKQMSIDADLNSGLINEKEAKIRRRDIEREADFYGAMDGASKFVRGDAISGIIIMFVNIIGGLLVGVFQRGLDLAAAAENYTMLTIGDGLVTQIPALIISTAAGTVVTRSSNESSMGSEIASQLFLKPRALIVVAGILGILGLIPGLPKTPFFIMSIFIGGIGWIMIQYEKEETKNKTLEAMERQSSKTAKREDIEKILPLDLIELEVGYNLIRVVESNESGDLLERIVNLRKQFALEMGVIIPSVHIRDNPQLDSGEYRILIKGSRVAGGELKPDSLLAMDPGNVSKKIEGYPTKEPTFGMEALWIKPSQKEEAEIAGYTVVDLPTVIATHLTETLRHFSAELFGREEANSLIENFKKSHPKVIEEITSDALNFGIVVKVLQNLLREGISIRDLLSIFEALADNLAKSKDPEFLTEEVRKSLRRSITLKFSDEEGKISSINLSSSLEEFILQSLLQTDQGTQLVMNPQISHDFIREISEIIQKSPEIGSPPLILTRSNIRRHIHKLISKFIPQIAILSHEELTPDAHVTSVATVELPHASQEI